VRFDRCCGYDPLTLRRHLDGVTRDLDCYLSDFIESKNEMGDTYITGIRLVAYDPFFYDPTETETWARSVQTFTVRNIVAKVTGAWDELGPPDAAGTYSGVFAIEEDDTYIYLGGNFLNWDNDGDADYIVQYNKATGVYSPLNATPLNGIVRVIKRAPDGIIYIGGDFTDAGGDLNADSICEYDPALGTFVSLNATGLLPVGVNAIEIAPSGILYIGGDFINAGGDGDADYFCQYDRTTGTFSSVNATPLGGAVYGIVTGIGGNTLYLGGQFSNAGGDADADRVCQCDIATGAYSALTSDSLDPLLAGTVYSIAIGDNGILYIGGSFDIAGGSNFDYICSWNGAAFQDMNGGADDTVHRIYVLADGTVIAGGRFTEIGGIGLTDRVAIWNGYTWAQLDIDLPGVAIVRSVFESGSTIYYGFDTEGYAIASVTNTIPYSGSVETYPIIEFSGTGNLQNLENEHTGDQMWIDMPINRGEIITFDLTPGVKTAESDWRGNVLPDIYPNSDFAVFSLVPDPVATDGDNAVSVFIAGQPLVYLDDQGPAGAAQLGLLENVSGLTDTNTDRGRLWIEIVDDGGGFFHVEFFSDAALANQTGHTASYNAAGLIAVAEDNDSGLDGQIYIVSATAVDANIYVDYALVKFRYHNRYWTLADALAD